MNEYPLYIAFDRERAIDLGGVSRDMFTAFFDEAYHQLFDGRTLLTPAIHDYSSLPVFGAIMSHSYLVSGVLPIRMVFPSLAQCLLGTVELSDDVFFPSLINSLSVHDAAVLKTAFDEVNAGATAFKRETHAGLLELASRFGSRHIPTHAICFFILNSFLSQLQQLWRSTVEFLISIFHSGKLWGCRVYLEYTKQKVRHQQRF